MGGVGLKHKLVDALGELELDIDALTVKEGFVKVAVKPKEDLSLPHLPRAPRRGTREPLVAPQW